MLAFPVGLISLFVVRNVWAVGLSLVATMAITALCDIWIARRAVFLSAWTWVKTVVVPIGALSFVVLAVGIVPSLVLRPSFIRIVMTTVMTLLVFCPMVWLLVLSDDERQFLRHKVLALFGRFG